MFLRFFRLGVFAFEVSELLIECASMVHALAYSAIRYRFSVVHAVVNGLDLAQICEDRFEVFVAHMNKEPPRHNRIELPSPHLAAVDDLQEKGFTVIVDAARIRRDIRAGYPIRTNRIVSGCARLAIDTRHLDE